jgi:rhodanese-related sulfurtransferase
MLARLAGSVVGARVEPRVDSPLHPGDDRLVTSPGEPQTLEDLLDAARARITRLHPHEAQAAVAEGALLVDIRGDRSREHDGIVPGSVHIPRTVLEWRLDPHGPWRNPHIPRNRRLVVICDHGFSSVLAAAGLVDLGVAGTADVVGGYEAWRLAGLPVAPAPRPRADGAQPGMGPPDDAVSAAP